MFVIHRCAKCLWQSHEANENKNITRARFSQFEEYGLTGLKNT